MEQNAEARLKFPSYFYKPKKGSADFEGFLGAIVEGQSVVFRFDDHESTVNINLIVKIVSERQVLTPSQSRYTLLVKEDGEMRYVHFPQLYFSAPTLQSLVRCLLSINPGILLDTETRQIIEKTYVASDKILFDFKVHGKNSRHAVVANSSKTQTPTFILAILMLALIAGVPIAGDTILSNRFGSTYAQYRIILLVVAGFLSGGSVFNLLMALQSKYKGHILTFGCLLLAVAAAVIAFL
jgi:hypothetical protein